MYVSYRCKTCHTIFIIPIEDVTRMEKAGRYIACNFGHKDIEILDKYDNIQECMDNHVYKRINRRIQQVK